MKVRQLPYVDWSSPGMIDPDRAERDDEGPLEDIEIDDDAPPEILEYAREQGYRPAHPRVLPPERFSDARATPEQCGMVNAPTGPDDTGPKSKTIRVRLACSCAGWKRPPTSDEFYEAVRREARQTPMGDPGQLEQRGRGLRDPGRVDRARLHVPPAGHGVRTGRHQTVRDRRGTEPPQHVTHAMDDLKLPSPARELWLDTRDAVRRALKRLQPGIEYRIGGGTILAARWGHRQSFDVDIQVGKSTKLRELESAAYGWLHKELERLGAKPEYSAELNLYRIRRGEGADSREVQVWGHELALARGHGPERVEGREETVLSTAQILRGKLERARRHPARDVYDVVKAATIDPVSLEIAVNTMPHDAVGKAALSWIVAYGRIGGEAHARLGGLAPGEERRHYQIGKTGGKAMVEARYAHLQLGLEDDRIVVDAVTQGSTRRRMTITDSEAEEQFEAKGI